MNVAVAVQAPRSWCVGRVAAGPRPWDLPTGLAAVAGSRRKAGVRGHGYATVVGLYGAATVTRRKTASGAAG